VAGALVRFRSLLADSNLLQAIQPCRSGTSTWPRRWPARSDRRLFRLLEYAVEVDPKFAGAYRFAAAALPHESMDGKVYGVLNTLQIMEKGLRERPDDWHIGFLLGFLQSYYLRDFTAAGRSLANRRQAARRASLDRAARDPAGGAGESWQIATSLAEAMLSQANEERHPQGVAGSRGCAAHGAGPEGDRGGSAAIPGTQGRAAAVRARAGSPRGSCTPFSRAAWRPLLDRCGRHGALHRLRAPARLRADHAIRDPRMTAVLVIAGNTVRELVRSKLLYNLLIFAVLFVTGSLLVAQLTWGTGTASSSIWAWVRWSLRAG